MLTAPGSRTAAVSAVRAVRRPARPVVRPTLRTRMALLYAALICGSGIALVGIIQGIGEAVDPGLFVRRHQISGPIQPGAIHAGHLASPIPFIGSNLFWTDVAGLTIMALFSLVLGWLIAGRFVRPLRAIITTSRDISASNLHRRLGLRGRGDEFTELGQTLDDLFARLEASFDSQRHFIANASHELRTPLAAGRALLQVAIADPEPTVEKLLATCEELVELGDRQERLIAALLTLANSQRGLELPEPLDLADITGKAVLDRRPDAERHGISLNTALDAAPAAGDPRLVESLIANLIDNAIRHNLPGGRVAVSTALTTAGAAITVGNTGALIPPGEVEDLFQPFRQLGTQRIRHGEGHGLGLAIVRAIAGAHGAALTATPRPQGGLDIEVIFPGPAPPQSPAPSPGPYAVQDHVDDRADEVVCQREVA